jgi:hypothetical protein
MSMTIITTIRNIHSDYSSAESWEDDGGLAGVWTRLFDAEESGEVVTIVCEATDGYFDIKFADGYSIEALSWWHLAGFDQDTLSINFNTLLS